MMIKKSDSECGGIYAFLLLISGFLDADGTPSGLHLKYS